MYRLDESLMPNDAIIVNSHKKQYLRLPMRSLFSFVLFVFSLPLFSQDWSLVSVDTSLKFPYEYQFRFLNADDSCSYQFLPITKDSATHKVTGHIMDFVGEAIPIARLTFVTKNGKVYKTRTDIKGNFVLDLPPGKYAISVMSMNHDVLRMELEITEENAFRLDCQLGFPQEITTYQINATTSLSEEEIESIMNCVKVNRNQNINLCNELGSYYVSIQI